ncbi:DUF4129 domain-containing transglutaminase family protein [Paenibacillus sp. GCM10027626]|uniref:DUF4129 domain-containing transglutaminase family protein n=1 Tax=Paenibacillus sp. GCM10027626 TaxID=3273411 RepID=UPI0036289A06
MANLQRMKQLFFEGWYRKLSAVFGTGIVLVWINCLGDYWWEETFGVIRAMLLATAAVAVVVPWRLLSLIVQLVTLLAVNLVYGDIYWPPAPSSQTMEQGAAKAWMAWCGEIAGQMSPIIWISLAVWAIVQAAVFAGTRRLGIVIFAGGALLTLLVADSLFTPIKLWGEIAFIVSLCLGWLVASHLAQFKQKHPDSWYELLKYPLSLFLPIMLVIAVVVGAGLFVPSIDPILKDPYTIWKESRGEAVPSYIGDKIGTEIAPPPKAADARSGYSRNDTQLGGGFQFDYSPVMEVTTNQKSYWRGETKARYTGKGWEDSPGERSEQGFTAIAAEQKLPLESESTAATTAVDQMFTMLREEDSYPILFGAGPIASVINIDGSQELPALVWMPQSWELHLKDGRHLQSYAVRSEVAVLDENMLLNSKMDHLSLDPAYLELPRGLPDRVRDLAISITAEEKTPYEKARAIESYLRSNFRYTNEPDLSKRKSDDFVDGFLFEIQEGYCDYFSTSMAVLARSVGIPTRWVKGYSSGTLNESEFMRMQGMPGESDGQGTYTVRNSDAHSWVEAYFSGYGWLPFEPTAGFSYPYVTASQESVPQEKEEQTEPAPVKKEEQAVKRSFPVWTIFAGAAVLLLAAAVWRYRTLVQAWRKYRDRSRTANERIVRETDRLLKHCRRKGLERSRQETVREAVLRWIEGAASLEADFRAVLALFEKALYSGRTMSEDEVSRFESHARAIREQLS